MKNLRLVIFILVILLIFLNCDIIEDIFGSEDPFPTFTSPINLSNSSEYSYAPDIATDSNGNIYVVWYDQLPGNRDIFFTKSIDEGKTWSPITNISNNSGTSAYPSLVIDSANSIHLAWRDDSGGNTDILYCSSSNGGSTWSPIVNVSNDSSSSSNPKLAVANGNIHLIWLDPVSSAMEYDIYYRRSTNGLAWTAVKNISNSVDYSSDYDITANNTGNVYIVWKEGWSADHEIFFSRSTDYGSNWSVPQNITNTPGESKWPSVETDQNNNIHIIWGEYISGNPDIYHTYSSDNGFLWTQKKNITNDSQASFFPHFGIGSNGNINVVWIHEATSTNFEIYYCRSTDIGETWSQVVNISNNLGYSNIVAINVDNNNNINIVWEDDSHGGKTDIYYARSIFEATTRK